MTTDERFDRLEHVVAGLAEERSKDREDYRQLWRDTQHQIGEVTQRINDLTVTVSGLAFKIADTNDAITRFAAESREADRKLGERVDALVSSIGELIRRSDRTPGGNP